MRGKRAAVPHIASIVGINARREWDKERCDREEKRIEKKNREEREERKRMIYPSTLWLPFSENKLMRFVFIDLLRSFMLSVPTSNRQI